MQTEGKVLSLDYGRKRIGMATGSFNLKIASPQGVLENKGFAYVAREVAAFCKKWEVSLIVLGLPLDMHEDAETEMSKAVRNFVSRLQKFFAESEDPSIKKIEIQLFDERLSSFEGDKLMTDAGKEHGKRHEYRDCYAAQIILQRFFDSTWK